MAEAKLVPFALLENKKGPTERSLWLHGQFWYLKPVVFYHRCGIFCLLFAADGKK